MELTVSRCPNHHRFWPKPFDSVVHICHADTSDSFGIQCHRPMAYAAFDILRYRYHTTDDRTVAAFSFFFFYPITMIWITPLVLFTLSLSLFEEWKGLTMYEHTFDSAPKTNSHCWLAENFSPASNCDVDDGSIMSCCGLFNIQNPWLCLLNER